MELHSFLTQVQETDPTVKDIRKKMTETERECIERIRELTELDEEFSSALDTDADGPARRRQSMELEQKYQQFRVKWSALVERLRGLQLLVTVDRVVPDETDETTPLREVEALNTEVLDAPSSDTVQPLNETLDRNEVEATIDRINEAAGGDIPFRERLVTAVLDEDETPPTGRSFEPIEPNSDERRARMAELLRQDETPSVHLWDLLAELDGI